MGEREGGAREASGVGNIKDNACMKCDNEACSLVYYKKIHD